MTIRKIVGFSVVLAAFGLATSCGDDDDDNGGAMAMAGGGMGGMGMAGNAGMGGMAMAGMGGMGMGSTAFAGTLGAANPPTLGARIDRVGRVAITAALIGAFNDDNVAEGIRDDYNEGNLVDPSNLDDLRRSLGILDGLDTNCGNQLLAGAIVGDEYGMLAQVLNDDQLYVDSSRGDCQLGSYLGVEAEAIEALPDGEGSCGGRLPGDDVIERSYSVLAAGIFEGVDDGVPADDGSHSSDFFPFIGEPTL